MLTTTHYNFRLKKITNTNIMSVQTKTDRFLTWLKTAKLDTKDYHVSGIEWVLNRELDPQVGTPGGFLCDEMGLGKTILMVGAIMSNFKNHNLIVLPLALLEQWRTVFVKFCGHDPLIYHGYKAKNIKVEDIGAAPIVLTTYGMIATRKKEKYQSLLWSVKWDRLIFDEAHHMRNAKSNTYRGGLKHQSTIKWMVTGTPINNGKNDFYNLCAIQGLSEAMRVNPTPDHIRAVIRAAVLKRTKQQVGIPMPELNIHSIEVEFETPAEELFARNIHSLLGFAPVTPENVDMVIRQLGQGESCLPVFMLMRQACVMPSLASDLLQRRAGDREFWDENLEIPRAPSHSKISAVVAKVLENKKSGKRKLIFCQFRSEIRKIQSLLAEHNISASIMDGSTPKKERINVLAAPMNLHNWYDAFMCKKWLQKIEILSKLVNPWLERDVLIVQIQTACEGLNLQHFSEVYFTTPHWNPAVEDQAIARSHRIGQKKSVDVYKFITSFSSDDDHNFHPDERKLSLDQYCVIVQNVKREKAKMIKNSPNP